MRAGRSLPRGSQVQLDLHLFVLPFKLTVRARKNQAGIDDAPIGETYGTTYFPFSSPLAAILEGQNSDRQLQDGAKSGREQSAAAAAI